MKNILEELYYGNICEIERKCEVPLEKFDPKEIELHEEIKEKLGEQSAHLLDEYLDVMAEREDREYLGKYSQGLKTGVLLGLEIADIEF